MKKGDGLRATDYGPDSKGLVVAVVSWLALLIMPAATTAATYSVIISGLGGEPEYEQRFREQADKLAGAARQLTGSDANTTLLSGAKADRESVKRALQALAANTGADDQVIITLIGHGTHDGEVYRLNLPGPDLTSVELAAMFDAIPASQQLIVNATSASGAVLEGWKRDRRIVITATKSGGERTATRFAAYWAAALTTLDADTNKDDIITALEAYEYANRKVVESFKSDALLASEHSRIAGADPARFQVARLGTAARVTNDPAVNELFAERVRIERELDDVRGRKTAPATDAYYDELEGVLVKLAMLQRRIDSVQPGATP